jgi:hypothetical protein
MLSSIGVQPLRIPEFLGWYSRFDHWAYHGAAINPDPDVLALLHNAAVRVGKPYRGNHLNVIDRRPGSPDSWGLREQRTATLTNGLPAATHWDAIHELHSAIPQIANEGQTPEEFAKQAIATARRYTDAPLFISEYRPDERIDWLVQFCEWARGSHLDLAGVSVQLHTHLVSRQHWYRGRIIRGLQAIRAMGYEIHLYECAAWERIAPTMANPLPRAVAEAMQAERYRSYKFIAEQVGASMFGPWFLSDRHCRYWVKAEYRGNAGILREDGSPKPSAAIFTKNPPG